MAATHVSCALGAGSSSFLLSGELQEHTRDIESPSAGLPGRPVGQRQPKRPSVAHQCRAAIASKGPQEEAAGKCAPPRPAGAGTLSRRALASLAIAISWMNVSPGQARERRQPKVDAAEYSTSSDGLKYYDFMQGKGPEAVKGKKVVVHFDCVYKTLTVVSSRSSKLLGGNRVIAQPYELIVGAKPGSERKRDFVDNANGLFSAQAAPKPPPALYTIVEGMKVGGKRTVIVPPDAGYGQRGIGEIPPGATFDMNIELLEVEDVQRES